MKGFIILVGLLVGCGSIEPRAPDKDWDPTLESILDAFLSDAGANGVSIAPPTLDRLRKMRFIETVPGTDTGLCRRLTSEAGPYTVSWQEIQIERQIADDIMAFKALMYHEFGHCLLGKEHVGQEPYQLMSPRLTYSESIEADWAELVKGLFH
jgi:hypothetical protein